MSTGRYFKTKKETIAGQRAIKKLKKFNTLMETLVRLNNG